LYSFLIARETSDEAPQGGQSRGFKPLRPGGKILVANDTKELSSKSSTGVADPRGDETGSYLE
jgi:hypothetical protein